MQPLSFRILLGFTIAIGCFAATRAVSLPEPHIVHHHRIASDLHWRRIRVIVTAYVVRHDPAGGCQTFTDHTATNTVAQRATVAGDPRLFPAGTRFRIPGYGYGIRRDTGGAILGKHIDVAMYSCDEAKKWGAPRLTISYALPPKHR
jgi:3D (Asp-Asp-Asp) domain-containing protein